MKIQKKSQGFTLVEIMIVVVIIGLLAAMAIPAFNKVRQTSQTKTCVNNLRQIESAKDQFALENGLGNEGTIQWPEIIGDYIKNDVKCPRGDRNGSNGDHYVIGAVGTPARCSAYNADDHDAQIAPTSGGETTGGETTGGETT